MIRPSVLLSAAAAIAAASLAIGAASGSSSATPAETVEHVVHAFAEGDATACDGLTPKARAAIVADAPPATDCPAMARLLGQQSWFVDALDGATFETTSQDASRAVVRLEFRDATVNWLRLVPAGDGWLVDGGPWDVRVS